MRRPSGIIEVHSHEAARFVKAWERGEIVGTERAIAFALRMRWPLGGGASDVQTKYGTEKQSITVTLASLANTSARGATAIDNTSNLYLDALVQVQLKSGASGVSTSGVANVYAYGTVDAADSLYPEGFAGTDAAITLTGPPNVRIVGVVNMVANATSYIVEPMSIAAAFGGLLPSHWGIVVENKTGAAFDATEGNHLKYYQGFLGHTT